MNELASIKPCPFCGKDAATGSIRYHPKTVKEQEWGQDTFYYVKCCWCGSDNRGLTGWRTTDLAVEHWNRRATVV